MVTANNPSLYEEGVDDKHINTSLIKSVSVSSNPSFIDEFEKNTLNQRALAINEAIALERDQAKEESQSGGFLAHPENPRLDNPLSITTVSGYIVSDPTLQTGDNGLSFMGFSFAVVSNLKSKKLTVTRLVFVQIDINEELIKSNKCLQKGLLVQMNCNVLPAKGLVVPFTHKLQAMTIKTIKLRAKELP